MLHTPALSRSSFWFKIAISAVLVGLADLLFFKHAPGTSLGLFAFVVLGGVLFQSKGPAAGSPSVMLHPRRSRLLPCGGGSPWSAGLGAVRRFNKRRRLVEPSWAERNSIGLDQRLALNWFLRCLGRGLLQPRRLHLSLGYISPARAERRAA